MEETTAIYEFFLNPDGSPGKISKALVTTSDVICKPTKDCGENGLYAWIIPPEAFKFDQSALVWVSVPEIKLEKAIIVEKDKKTRISEAEECCEQVVAPEQNRPA